MTEPAFQDEPPCVDAISAYDERHLATYVQILDEHAAGSDWREVAKRLFDLDADAEPERARRVFDNHLARARWMTERGYRHLAARGRENP